MMRLAHSSSHVLQFVAILLCAGLGFATPNLSFAQEDQATEDEPSQQNDSHIHIPPQHECLEKTGNWSEPELWAWTKICAREPIDFDKRYGGQRDRKDFDKLVSDSRRHLSAEFLRQILEDSQLAPYTQNAAIDIIGAFLPSIQFSNASIGSLGILYSKVGGDIYIDRTTILRNIRITGSEAGDVVLRSIQGGDFNFNNSHLGEISISEMRLSRLGLINAQAASLKVQISRFEDQLSIIRGRFGDIRLNEIKSDGLFLRPSLAGSIDVNAYVDTGVFYLEVGRWRPDSSLTLRSVSAGRFFLRKDPPAKVTISGFSFSGADWGVDPRPLLKRWMAATSTYNPGVYTALAASYAEAGQSQTANDVLIARQNAEFLYSESPSMKAYLFMTWLLANYGYRPEIGLLWILGFVGVATLVFRSGEQAITSGSRPRNWFVFAFDSVIPGVQLDDQHRDIAFSGWRQYFLYFLRFLGAVVVVLILQLLKESFSGLG